MMRTICFSPTMRENIYFENEREKEKEMRDIYVCVLISVGSVRPMRMTMMVVENETSCPFHTRLVVCAKEEREREKEKEI